MQLLGWNTLQITDIEERGFLLDQCPGRFLGIVGRDPSVSKTSWLHVDIFQFLFIRFCKLF